MKKPIVCITDYGFANVDTERKIIEAAGGELRTGQCKSPAQVVLRWHHQRGVCAIPKTIRESELKENLDIFDFELSAEDMAAITALDHNYHFLRPRDWFGLPLWDGNLG
jgi:diketogulonate reductase-like aldo/keto reductase